MSDDHLRRLIEDAVDSELRYGHAQNPRDVAIRVASDVMARLRAEGISLDDLIAKWMLRNR